MEHQMDCDNNLSDAAQTSTNWRLLIAVLFAEVLILGMGVFAGVHFLLLATVMTMVACGFGVILWPPSRDEREATDWWNALSKSEREKWLAQGGSDKHYGAWKAYKLSTTSGK